MSQEGERSWAILLLLLHCSLTSVVSSSPTELAQQCALSLPGQEPHRLTLGTVALCAHLLIS